jgi:hypothetical protein
MCMCLLACLIAIIAIHALPAPISTEVATINPDHELAKRIPSWGQTWRVFAFNAEIYWKAGGCIALGCYQGGDVNSAEGVGIATGIIYGVAAFAKSFLPEEWRPGQPYRRRGENADWDKYLNLVEDAGLSDDLPLLLEFQEHHRDQVTFHTKYADLDVSRLQVMHPIKRSMENIIRIRTHPDQGSKRQEAYYGIEAFFHEESDYGYPPDRGWVGELANTVGNSISEHQGEGDMCMKMVNFDGATSYSYIRYDGTPDNEEYDNVFGCDVASYD